MTQLIPATTYTECFLFKIEQLPFRIELLPELPLVVEKSSALTILKRGRSKGNPSLKCKDRLTSTTKSKF